MQTAMILSDLKSLSVCGHEEALNLVSVHKTISTSIKESSGHLELGAAPEAFDETHPEQPDLQRATDLVGLHHSVKLKHLEGGLDAELQNGRENVKRVLKDLNSKSRA